MKSDSAGELAWQTSDWLIVFIVAFVTLLSRFFTRGELYFADGPRLVYAITSGVFVIQPPGYWLYTHLAALFHDPVLGLAFWNESFSALGVGVFYVLARWLGAHRVAATLAALAYSSIFFSWFAGVTHSSYASQMLFPPATVLGFLAYKSRPSYARLLLAAVLLGVGTGLRPSDGILLAPLWLFLLFVCVRTTSGKLILLAIFAAITLGWYLPTRSEYNVYTVYRDSHYGVGVVLRNISPLENGLTEHSGASIVRVLLPLAVAFFALIPAMFARRKPEDNLLLALWVVPGVLFLLLVYMSDASYMTFLTGGIVLLAALAKNRRLAAWCLAFCCLVNVSLYLKARPIKSQNASARAYDFYIVKYCNYGVRHQWMTTLGSGAEAP